MPFSFFYKEVQKVLFLMYTICLMFSVHTFKTDWMRKLWLIKISVMYILHNTSI